MKRNETKQNEKKTNETEWNATKRNKTKNKNKRNGQKRNETKRKQTKRTETQRKENKQNENNTKRNENKVFVTFSQCLSFDWISFYFLSLCYGFVQLTPPPSKLNIISVETSFLISENNHVQNKNLYTQMILYIHCNIILPLQRNHSCRKSQIIEIYWSL